MDIVKTKSFGDEVIGEDKDAEPKNIPVSTSSELPPKKRKTRHKKFIDLQKQPPKPPPLVQE